MNIGFIGLGHMGLPMVKNLLKAGNVVFVFDIVPEAIQAAAISGAIAVNAISALAKKSDIVFTMLQTGEQVKKVCLEKDGVFSHLHKDALFIDSSSIDVKNSRDLHHAAASRDIAMLDAPVSGGVAAATAGTLTFMVGGHAHDFEKAKNTLSLLGKKMIYAGSAGAGVAAKICNNMLLGISMIGVCETFLLAEKLGLAADKLFEICSNASGECWSLTHYCPWPSILPNVPSSHHYEPGFTAKMMLKDLLLSQSEADAAGLQTPLGKHAAALYEQFSSSSAEMDFSGIIEMLRS